MLLDGKLDEEEGGTGSSTVPERGWFVKVGIFSVAIYWAFAAFGQPGRGMACACMSGAIIVAVRLNVKQWQVTRFWIWTAIVSLFHVVLVFTVHWPSTEFRATALSPIGLLDILIVYFFLRLVGGRSEQSSVDNDS